MFIKLLKNSLIIFVCSMGVAFAGEIEDNLKKSCDRGVYSDCITLGRGYDDVIDNKLIVAKTDNLKALKLYTKACDGGYARGCVSLGVKYAKGIGVRYDINKALKLYTKACDMGDAWGCVLLGLKYANGDGVKQDKIKAKDIYTKSCNKGGAPGCVSLGWMYADGAGVEQNEYKAKELFIEACNMEEGWGCHSYDRILSGDEYIKKLRYDVVGIYGVVETVDVNTKACDMGNAEGCFNLGNMHDIGGIVVNQDKFKAAAAYTKACDGGYAWACHNLGIMYEHGEGVRQSYNKALDLFGKACDLKYGDGCKKYADLNFIIKR